MPPAPIVIRRARWGLRGPITDVLIADGFVTATGAISPADAPAGAQVIDGSGGTLLPGLRDAHVHMTQWATGLQRIDLSAAISAADAVRLVVTATATADRPGLVWGKNFRDGLWPDAPHRRLLDEALPGRAVALVSNDLHCIWLSGAALALIGVDHPTGLLREQDCFDAITALPGATIAESDRWVNEAATAATTRGVTSILDFEFIDTETTWQRRSLSHFDGKLPIRVDAAIHRPLLEAAMARGLRTGDRVADTAGLVRIGPCKVLIDGSLNTRTAYCHDHYPESDQRGLLTEDPDDLSRTIARAAATGISFAVHAIGDEANRIALDCFAAAGSSPDQPGRIEHAQLIDDVDLPRFAALGVTASVQPGHAPEDRDVAELHWAGRTRRAFPYGALLGAGATMEFGSDAPVSRLDPWYAIAAAVFRTVDERPSWHPEQQVTLDQAIAASTGGRSLHPGMVADLTLTATDPITASRAELASMPVAATLLGGRLTHRS